MDGNYCLRVPPMAWRNCHVYYQTIKLSVLVLGILIFFYKSSQVEIGLLQRDSFDFTCSLI